jgi:nicotinamidase-related amidase
MNWNEYALVLIDVQNDFVNDLVNDGEKEQYIENVKGLLNICRTNGIEVIHLNGKFKKDKSDWLNFIKYNGHSVLVEETEGFNHGDFVDPIGTEKVIYKQSLDAFINTELDSYLKYKQKKFLFVAGLDTSVCVLFTAMHAIQLGYWTCFITDCIWDEKPNHDQVLEMYKDFIINYIGHREINDSNNYDLWNEMILGTARRKR